MATDVDAKSEPGPEPQDSAAYTAQKARQLKRVRHLRNASTTPAALVCGSGRLGSGKASAGAADAAEPAATSCLHESASVGLALEGPRRAGATGTGGHAAWARRPSPSGRAGLQCSSMLPIGLDWLERGPIASPASSRAPCRPTKHPHTSSIPYKALYHNTRSQAAIAYSLKDLSAAQPLAARVAASAAHRRALRTSPEIQ
jgi:hypothetical protein